MLAEPAALLAFVAKQLGDRIPADRLAEPVGPRRYNSRQGRGHLRTQRDLAFPFVYKVVELTDDLVAALRGVQLQRLQRWSIPLLKTITRRNGAPGIEQVGPEGEVGWVKVPKSRQGLGLHRGGNLRGWEEWRNGGMAEWRNGGMAKP